MMSDIVGNKKNRHDAATQHKNRTPGIDADVNERIHNGRI